jgi:WD40 repeat protein
VLTADFRPEGAWLAAGTADNTVRLWNLDPEQVADYVCATAGDPLTRAEWDRYVTGVPYRPPCPRA